MDTSGEIKNTFILTNEITTDGILNDASIGPNNYIAISTSLNFKVIKTDENDNVEEVMTTPEMVKIAVWSPLGNYVYNGKKIYRTNDWTPINGIDANYGCWSPDEEHFISYKGSQTILWDTSDWSQKMSWDDIFLNRLYWMNNTDFIGVSSLEFVHFNINDAEPLDRYDAQVTNDSENARASIYQNTIAIADGSSTARLFNITTGELEQSLFGHEGHIYGVSYSPLNDGIITCGGGGSIRVWWGPDFKEKEVTDLYNGDGSSTCSWSPDGGRILSGSRSGNFVHIWVRSDRPLIADAGDDITVLTNETFYLDGSRSQGNIPYDGYSWDILDSDDEIIRSSQEKRFGHSIPTVGKYTARLTVSDGTNEDSDELTITVIQGTDLSDPPSVLITSPKNGDTVGGTVMVTGTAADDYGVKYVYLQIDDNTWMVCQGTDDWSISIDSKEYSDGYHVIHAVANDGTLNSEEAVIGLYFDNTGNIIDDIPPQISILTPKDGSVLDGSIVISGTATDNVHVELIQVSFDNRTWLDAGLSDQWQMEFDTRTLSNGDYTLTARASDRRSMSTDSVHVTVKNDARTNDAASLKMNYSAIMLFILFVIWFLIIISIIHSKRADRKEKRPK